MSVHSKYSPSKLSRILACPGSVKRCEKLEPEPSSSYAEEGTMLHDVIANILEGDLDFNKATEKLSIEQRGCIKRCVNYVDEIKAGLALQSDKSTWIELVESRVSLASIGLSEINGTADYILIYTTRSGKIKIIVIDWKFGKGVPVSAIGNTQLHAYGLGAYFVVPCASRMTVHNIQVHVAQPRLNSYTSEDHTPNDLITWSDHVKKRLDLAKSDNPPVIPGEEQCRWCLDKYGCVERHGLAADQATNIFTNYVHNGKAVIPTVSAEQLIELYNQSRILEDYMKGLKKHIIAKGLNGDSIPGYKVVEGRSNRTWVDKKEATQFCVDNDVEIEDLYVSKLISPSAAERLLGTKIKKTTEFKDLWYKPKGGPLLVRETDSRESMAADAAAIFSNFVIDKKDPK